MIAASRYGRSRLRRFLRQPEWRIEKSGEPDVCPYVSKQSFSPDLARYCLINRQGGTCTTFRLKPFENCPIYETPRPDHRQLTIESWAE